MAHTAATTAKLPSAQARAAHAANHRTCMISRHRLVRGQSEVSQTPVRLVSANGELGAALGATVALEANALTGSAGCAAGSGISTATAKQSGHDG